MDLLIDTQSLFWTAALSRKLSTRARDAIANPRSRLLVSAVTAFEYVDLNRRARFGVDAPLDPILHRLGAVVVDYPAAAIRLAEALPEHHFDPVDRMMIAHAMLLDVPLISSDRTVREYPVTVIW